MKTVLILILVEVALGEFDKTLREIESDLS